MTRYFGEYSIEVKTSSIGKVLHVRYKNHELGEVSTFAHQKIKLLKTQRVNGGLIFKKDLKKKKKDIQCLLPF